ncbi:hypothetical protein Tco_0248765, partial [Tanacetum coccineum]
MLSNQNTPELCDSPRVLAEPLYINPKAVKQEFFQHFQNRFDKPPDQNAHIDMPFPNSLSTDQHKDLECMVSKEEVKRAVWDCGTDKSPSPDGFTFGFYRHFWSTIENDVFEAI